MAFFFSWRDILCCVYVWRRLEDSVIIDMFKLTLGKGWKGKACVCLGVGEKERFLDVGRVV